MTETDARAAFEAFKRGALHAGDGRWKAAHPHFLEAFKQFPSQIRYALYLGGTLWETGRREEAVEFWSLAADRDPAIRTLQYQPDVDAMTRQVSKVADSQIRLTLSNLQAQKIAEVAAPGRMATAFWPQTHIRPTHYLEGGPRPYIFYAPDLPQTSIFDRAEMSWVSKLEAQTEAIRKEFLALSDNLKDVGAPYVAANGPQAQEWDQLRGQDNWTSVHIFKDGARMPAADMCPVVVSALAALPLVYHNGNPMEVFFSVLKPGTHIPPHFGLANSRVTVHLPLIIPENCAIRVGKETHKWTEGEAFLFDDSFDHEAWNKSDQTRVVLIFEAWRPDMSAGEIAAVEASFKARQGWLDARRIPET